MIKRKDLELAGVKQEVSVQEVPEVPETPEEQIAEKAEIEGSIQEAVPVPFPEDIQEAHLEVKEAEEIDPLGSNEAGLTLDQETAEGGVKRVREGTKESPEGLIALPVWISHQEEEENRHLPVIQSLLH